MAHLLIDYSERVGFGFSVIVNHYLRVSPSRSAGPRCACARSLHFEAENCAPRKSWMHRSPLVSSGSQAQEVACFGNASAMVRYVQVKAAYSCCFASVDVSSLVIDKYNFVRREIERFQREFISARIGF